MADFGLVAAFLKSNFINQIIFIGLLLISIYSWAVVFAKFSWFKLVNKHLAELNVMASALEDYNGLKFFINTKPYNVYCKVLNAILHKKDHTFAVNDLLSSHTSKLNYLASVASVAPFVGLFGTVIGVISSFNAIGASKSASLAVIAPGIAEALYATAVGLFVAIPALWFYNAFVAKLSTIEDKQDDILQLINSKLLKLSAIEAQDKEQPQNYDNLMSKLLINKVAKSKVKNNLKKNIIDGDLDEKE